MAGTGESFRHRITRYLRKNLLAGVLVITPLAVVILILYWIFSNVDNIAQPVIEAISGRKIPGLGFAIFLILIYIVGIIASNYLGKRIVRFFESLITRVPVFRQLYTGAKQVVEGLLGVGMNKMAFREVVFVEFPRDGMSTMAFITNETIDKYGQKLYTIYVPTPPTPTSGLFEMVPEDRITHTDIPIDEGLKTVISCGMILPDEETIYRAILTGRN
jgi:uncharacterized membrane protein